MIEAIKKLRPDYCIRCNTERSLECYDSRNTSINYSILIDKYYSDQSILDRIENMDISHIRCRNCGSTYSIDWRSRLPIPLRSNIDVNIFVNKQLKK